MVVIIPNFFGPGDIETSIFWADHKGEDERGHVRFVTVLSGNWFWSTAIWIGDSWSGIVFDRASARVVLLSITRLCNDR